MLDGLVLGTDTEYWQSDGRIMCRDSAFYSVDVYCRQHPTELLIKVRD